MLLGHFGSKLRKVLSHVTVEPLMFFDGACHWSMQVFMEIVQMNKICSVSLGLPHEVCANLSSHHEENILVQRAFSLFVFQNSIIMSVLPLIFVLFMGSWSDKYGRKIPLMISTSCHVLWSGGYLLNSWQASWPIEMMYLVTLFDSLGGGPQGLVSTSVAYISDVTPLKSRTARVSITMSLWYLGGPLGNIVGALAIQYGGINLALGIVFLVHLSTLSYTVINIKESHGPFAVIKPVDDSPGSEIQLKKEDITKSRMILDFFNWRRVAEAFKTTFRSREGYTRAILLAVIVANMIRRAARGFFMYMFVRRALNWEAALYTYWTSYRTLIAAAGSLVLVPLLSRLISITDPMLIVVGSLSLIGEYCCYGSVSGIATAFFVWLGPLAGIISNASIIAQKSLATKLVFATEKGRVSAVMSATQSLMPMVGYAMYAPIYHQTVERFPQAQFFFGSCLVTIIMVTFLAIQLSNIAAEMKKADPEKEETKEEKSGKEVKAKVSFKLSTTSETEKSLSGGKPYHESSMSSPSENNRNICIKYNNNDNNNSINYQLTKESKNEPEKCDTERGSESKESVCYGNRMSDAEILESEKVEEETTSHGDNGEATNQRDKLKL